MCYVIYRVSQKSTEPLRKTVLKQRKSKENPVCHFASLSLRPKKAFISQLIRSVLSHANMEIYFPQIFVIVQSMKTTEKLFVKIVRFEIAGRYIAAYSTGANEFGKKMLNLEKAAESIDLSCCKDVKDGIPFICNRFYEMGAADDFQITFFSASEDGFFTTEYKYTALPQPSDKWDTREEIYKKNRPTFYVDGTNWAQTLVAYINLKTEL